jgi:hypothetical protein
MREAIFGARDGLVSTLAVVNTASGATNDRGTVARVGAARRRRSSWPAGTGIVVDARSGVVRSMAGGA